MAESKGCRKALRSVMRGEPVSTKPASGAPSNMRDCVATLEVASTRRDESGQKDRKKKRTGLRPVRDHGIEFQLKTTFCRQRQGRWRTSFGSAQHGPRCPPTSVCP